MPTVLVTSSPISAPGFAGRIAAKVVTIVGDNVVFAGRCRLDSILLNTAAGGVITVFDNASAGTGAMLYRFAGNAAAGTFSTYLGSPCANGIVVTQATAATTMTVCYTTE